MVSIFFPQPSEPYCFIEELFVCVYGFDLVFVSLVISALNMEIISQGPACSLWAHQEEDCKFKAKCQRKCWTEKNKYAPFVF